MLSSHIFMEKTLLYSIQKFKLPFCYLYYIIYLNLYFFYIKKQG